MFDADKVTDFEVADEGAGSEWQSIVEVHLIKEEYDAATNVAGGPGADTAAALNALAKVALAKGEKEEAKAKAEAAVEKFRSANATRGEAVALHTLARINLDMYNYDEAERLAQEALNKFGGARSARGEGAAGNTLAKIFFVRGKQEDAVKEADKAVKKFQSVADRIGEAAALITKATVKLFTGNLDETEKFCKQAVGLLKQVTKPGSQIREADALLLIGAAFIPLRQEKDAVKSAMAAYEMHQTYLNGLKGTSVALRALAFCTMVSGNLEEAVKLAGEAVMNTERIVEKQVKASIFATAAVIYRVLLWAIKMAEGKSLTMPAAQGGKLRQTSDFEQEAKALGQDAASLFHEAGDEHSAALVRVELAQLMALLGELQEGLGEAATALGVFQQTDEKAGQAIAMLTLAEIQGMLGKIETAIGSAWQAQELFKESGSTGDGDTAAAELMSFLDVEYKKMKKKEAWGHVPGFVMPDPQQQVGVSPTIYKMLIGRQFVSPNETMEISFDTPAIHHMGAMLGVNIPFLRPEGMPPPAGPVPPPQPGQRRTVQDIGSVAAPKPAAPGPAGGGGRPMAQPAAKMAAIAPAQPQIIGNDGLGGRLFDCPEEVHARMLELASTGSIPTTNPEQRSKFLRKRPTFYGEAEWKEAVRFGYLHPDITPPRGWKWKKQASGYKLARD